MRELVLALLLVAAPTVASPSQKLRIGSPAEIPVWANYSNVLKIGWKPISIFRRATAARTLRPTKGTFGMRR